MTEEKQKPLVSVITGYFNRKENLSESVNSILNQTYDNFEYIIFDDCSTDGTYEKIKEVVQNDPRVKLIRHSENIGFTQGMINAVQLARGKYIAIHGAGDVSYANRIEKQCDFLKNNPSVGLVGSLRKVINKTKLDKLNEHKGQSWIEGEPFLGDASKIILDHNLFAHGGVVYRESIYQKAGGYRQIFQYAQDRDLWIRMSKLCDFSVLSDILYERYFISDAVSVNPEKKLIQKYLSELAIQCSKNKNIKERDIVDRFGIYAAFFLDGTKKMSVELSKQAIKWYNQDMLDEARLYSNEAIKQNKNIISLLINLVVIKLPLSIGKKINNLIFKLYS